MSFRQGKASLALYSCGTAIKTDPCLLRNLVLAAPRQLGEAKIAVKEPCGQLMFITTVASMLDPWSIHGFRLRETINLIVAVRHDRSAIISLVA